MKADSLKPVGNLGYPLARVPAPGVVPYDQEETPEPQVSPGGRKGLVHTPNTPSFPRNGFCLDSFGAPTYQAQISHPGENRDGGLGW